MAIELIIVILGIVLGYGISSLKRLHMVKKCLDRLATDDPDFTDKIAIIRKFNTMF